MENEPKRSSHRKQEIIFTLRFSKQVKLNRQRKPSRPKHRTKEQPTQVSEEKIQEEKIQEEKIQGKSKNEQIYDNVTKVRDAI